MRNKQQKTKNIEYRILNREEGKKTNPPYSIFHIPYSSAGFTLIEMLVTVSIFALISTIVVVRNSQFDNETLLHSLAYDVALSIRQAQQFGVNVRGAANEFDNPYGISFTANLNTYDMFLDRDGDGFYNDKEELLETFTLGRGATIGTLCDLTGVESSCVEQESINIVFRRPDPDAIINNGETGRASIELRSARNQGRRLIIVESTGQIAIERPVTIEATEEAE